jgi:hypothetical protein
VLGRAESRPVPIELREIKTKSGHPILHTTFITEVTMTDARAYHVRVIPGGEYQHWGHLVVGNVTGVSGEVKKLFASKQSPTHPPPVAIVLTSALARMAASLTMRLTNNSNSESFKNEQEGLEWLDTKMSEFLRKK